MCTHSTHPFTFILRHTIGAEHQWLSQNLTINNGCCNSASSNWQVFIRNCGRYWYRLQNRGLGLDGSVTGKGSVVLTKPVMWFRRYRRERARREEDQVFHARPVKHKRSSEKTRQVDYDQGGYRPGDTWVSPQPCILKSPQINSCLHHSYDWCIPACKHIFCCFPSTRYWLYKELEDTVVTEDTVVSFLKSLLCLLQIMGECSKPSHRTMPLGEPGPLKTRDRHAQNFLWTSDRLNKCRSV